MKALGRYQIYSTRTGTRGYGAGYDFTTLAAAMTNLERQRESARTMGASDAYDTYVIDTHTNEHYGLVRPHRVVVTDTDGSVIDERPNETHARADWLASRLALMHPTAQAQVVTDDPEARVVATYGPAPWA